MNNSNKIIISLLVANLAATVWFGTNTTAVVSSQKPYEKASQHQLPDLINSSVKSEILNTFIKHFNSKNYDALYDMFGPVAKAQIPRKDMDVEFGKLTKYFHSVESGSFSFAEFSGQQGSSTVYVLNYTVNLSEKSDFGEIGTLKITIAIDGNEYQIYGIRLNGET
ncbi:hypothetical protein RI845_15025 [Thalassotalea nanhaiensis]|uniref:Nuclear transport factor 2 family protein n=1 Tax=Thalassotalea nanhaiensis TaxID=3065648 RepID=A0ABY9TGD7_9GAMM|nr:hypothetical protein RI845_15025 [Colwelliaceae bacterium SQ345]